MPAARLGETPLAVVDVETTGLSPWLHDRVVEVAVVRADPTRGILDEFVTLINPDRDVGPTSIHGITASDVAGAPRFNEITGDVARRVEDAVVVGHNVRFDLGFLVAEFARAGVDVPNLPALCTLRMAGLLRPGLASRKLRHCCEEVGIEHQDAHSALADARATAHLVACYLALAERTGLGSLEQLGCTPLELPPPGWCPAPPSRRALTRSSSSAQQAAARSYLARLVERLPPTPFEDPDQAAYLDLLDRCLEDRRITEQEADALFRTAQEWGLSRARVFETHHSYLTSLARAALADGVVSAVERRDLKLVCELLGLHDSALDEALRGAPAGRSTQPTDQDRSPSDLAGLSVCFTGELSGTVRGRRLTRDVAEELAMKAGLFVRKGVSGGLDLLVAADPETMSDKAKKARECGVRIMAAAVFFGHIGVDRES